VTATLNIPISATGGPVTITLTPTSGNATPATVSFYVQIPTTLIRTPYLPGAPTTGYGPLNTPVNGPILNAAGDVLLDANNNPINNACGVYRDLSYSVVDQEAPAKIIQGPTVDIQETFSNYTGPTGDQPAPLTLETILQNAPPLQPPQGDILDVVAVWHRYPTCLMANENLTVTQSFSLVYGRKTFPLTLTNSISMGSNLNNTLKADVTISHP
jgi:hypothetical protein